MIDSILNSGLPDLLFILAVPSAVFAGLALTDSDYKNAVD